MTRYERLEAKVKARNRVHEELLKRTPAILEALAPFVGQKVQNATGLICEKVKKVLPELPNSVAVSAWVNASKYSVRVEFKTCEGINGGCGCCYAEQSFTLGELESDSGVLKSVSDNPAPEHYRTNYNTHEIETLRTELEAAENAKRFVESKLNYFGKYDN